MGKKARGDSEGGGKIGRPPKYPRPAHCPHVNRKEHARGVCYQCSKNMSNRIYKQRKRANARAEAEARAGAARERKEQGLDAILAEAAAEDVAQLASSTGQAHAGDTGGTARRSRRRLAGITAAAEEETATRALPLQPLVPLAEAAARAGRREMGRGLDLNQGMEEISTLSYTDDIQEAALLLPTPASPTLPTDLDLPQEKGKAKAALSPASFFSLSSRLSTEATGQASEKDGTYYWYVPVANSNSHVRIAGSTPNFSASLESIMNEIAVIAGPPGDHDTASSMQSDDLLGMREGGPSVQGIALDDSKKDIDGSLLNQLAIIFGTAPS